MSKGEIRMYDVLVRKYLTQRGVVDTFSRSQGLKEVDVRHILFLGQGGYTSPDNPVIQAQIARGVGVDIPRTSRCIEKLVGRGFVNARRNPEDGRRKDVWLEAIGQELYDAFCATLF